MDSFLPIAQLGLGLLSLPLLTAVGSWLWKRVSRETRLLADVERLARVFPMLPEGEEKATYAERVNDALRTLNARLDPLDKRERQRKRKVVAIVLASVLVLSLLVMPGVDEDSRQPITYILGVFMGAVVVATFELIERDTKRRKDSLKTFNGHQR